MSAKIRKVLSLALTISLLFQQLGFAQIATELNIASHLSRMASSMSVEKFRPLHLRYFAYNPLNDNFKVLVDKGDFTRGLSPKGTVPEEKLRSETQTLLNYFLVGVSLPDSMFWVNLRPDSEDQIIDSYLEKTDVGRIMLEADLQLKKDTSLATSPKTPEGREYWDRLYKKAEELYGYENVTIPTLTRPWIVPGEIIVRESSDSAYIYKATLKVMLESDYLQKTGTVPVSQGTVPVFSDSRSKALNEYSTQLIKELIIPKLTKEVNSSKRYAPLRQVYYSLILSRWFKLRFTGKTGTYASLINTKNLTNLISREAWSKTEYFKQYQKSFADGEYNIQEPVYTPTGQVIRSYFSGGMNFEGMLPQNRNNLAGMFTADSPTLPKDTDTVLFSGDPTGIKVSASPIQSLLTVEKGLYNKGLTYAYVEKLVKGKEKIKARYGWQHGYYKTDLKEAVFVTENFAVNEVDIYPEELNFRIELRSTTPKKLLTIEITRWDEMKISAMDPDIPIYRRSDDLIPVSGGYDSFGRGAKFSCTKEESEVFMDKVMDVLDKVQSVAPPIKTMPQSVDEMLANKGLTYSYIKKLVEDKESIPMPNGRSYYHFYLKETVSLPGHSDFKGFLIIPADNFFVLQFGTAPFTYMEGLIKVYSVYVYKTDKIESMGNIDLSYNQEEAKVLADKVMEVLSKVEPIVSEEIGSLATKEKSIPTFVTLTVNKDLQGLNFKDVEKAIASGKMAIAEVSVDWARKIKETFPNDVYTIFISPLSEEQITERMVKGQTREEVIVEEMKGRQEERAPERPTPKDKQFARANAAPIEMARQNEYDTVIVSKVLKDLKKDATRWAGEEGAKIVTQFMNAVDNAQRAGKKLILYSGPSATGKGPLWNQVKQKYADQFSRIVLYTTRAPKADEIEGVDYYFRSVEQLKDIEKKLNSVSSAVDNRARISAKLAEIGKNSGLPISKVISKLPAGVSDNAIWAETLRALHFDSPVYRRVEREAKTEERYTGNTAFTNVDKDTDVKQLTTYDVSTPEFYSIRKGEDVRGFILDSSADIPPEAYFMHRGIFASRADIQKAFYDNKIRFDITIIPPALWGVDFAKTVGHYHDPVDKPEIYQVVSGEVLWLMQKTDDKGNVVDFITVKAKAGDIAIMLPGYGHVSVNISKTEPLVLANWLTWHQSSYYGSFKEKKGAAYYVIKNNQNNPELMPNPEYLKTQKVLPQPRQMTAKDQISEFGLTRGKPIYDLIKLDDNQFRQNVRFLNYPGEFMTFLTPEATLDKTTSTDGIRVNQAVEEFTEEVEDHWETGGPRGNKKLSPTTHRRDYEETIAALRLDPDVVIISDEIIDRDDIDSGSMGHDISDYRMIRYIRIRKTTGKDFSGNGDNSSSPIKNSDEKSASSAVQKSSFSSIELRELARRVREQKDKDLQIMRELSRGSSDTRLLDGSLELSVEYIEEKNESIVTLSKPLGPFLKRSLYGNMVRIYPSAVIDDLARVVKNEELPDYSQNVLAAEFIGSGLNYEYIEKLLKENADPEYGKTGVYTFGNDQSPSYKFAFQIESVKNGKAWELRFAERREYPFFGPTIWRYDIVVYRKGRVDCTKVDYNVIVNFLDWGGLVTHVMRMLRGIQIDRTTKTSSPIEVNKNDVDASMNSAYILKKEVGGIDFRTLPMTIQPMGSFSGLNFKLPQLSQAELGQINVDSEIQQIKNMVQSGIIPSGQRIKELIAACIQKKEMNSQVDNLLLCLADIFKLEEENASESSPELREALVIVDSRC